MSGQATVKLMAECYQQLENFVKEVAENKKRNGIPGRTTFSEVIAMLLRERKGASL